MTFHSLPHFHSRLHVTSHWRQQNMIQNFHTSHHRHHHVLQPEGTDNQWCTSWWRASPWALPSWAASFRFLTKVIYGALNKKSTVYTRSVNLTHQKRNVQSKWPSEIWNFQSSCHPKRSPVKQYSQAPREVASFEPKNPQQVREERNPRSGGLRHTTLIHRLPKEKLRCFLHLGNQSNMH